MKSLNPKPYTINPQSGFIALTSAIVISLLLLAITLSLGMSSFLGRFDILDSESKERSMALAEACVDSAKLDIAGGGSYTGPITVGSDQCSIVSITDSGNNKVIKAHAEINKSHTNLKVVVDSSTFDTVSWEECANFGSSC